METALAGIGVQATQGFRDSVLADNIHLSDDNLEIGIAY